MICQGSIQGVQLAARLLVRAGVRRVALEDPCGDELRAAVRRRRARRRSPLPTDAHGLVVEALAGTGVGRRVPHAGAPVSRRRHAAARAPPGAAGLGARGADALLVEDDYDGELRYDRRPVGALQGLARERVIYIGTASRTLAPALRLGWIVVPPQLADDAGALRWELGGASPSLDQLAFARLLTSAAFERGVRRLRVEYARRRTALLAALQRALPGAVAGGSAAGLHLTLSCPRRSAWPSWPRPPTRSGSGCRRSSTSAPTPAATTTHAAARVRAGAGCGGAAGGGVAGVGDRDGRARRGPLALVILALAERTSRP